MLNGQRKLPVLKSAACGVLVWLVYGIVELILLAGVQLWRFSEAGVLSWQWRLIAMLLGAYSLVGAIAGAAGGVLLPLTNRDSCPQTLRAWSVWTVVIAFLFNFLVVRQFSRSEFIALALAVLVAALLSMGLFFHRATRFQIFANPWSVSVLLLAAPWVNHEAQPARAPASTKTLLLLLLVGLSVGGAALASRLRRGKTPALSRQAAIALAVLGAFVAIGWDRGRDVVAAPVEKASQLDRTKPNILLITMDTVRADHLSLYGYERDTTPMLRELARSATLYTRAVAVSDYTLPTHGSIFTGMYPEWHGAHVGGADAIGASCQTLAEVLRSKGYWTAQAVANYLYLGAWTGLTRGFEFAKLTRPVPLEKPFQRIYLRHLAKAALGLVVDTGEFDARTVRASDIVRRAGRIIESAQANNAPFFLFLNFMDAHSPLVPESPFDARFPGKDPELVSYSFGSGSRDLYKLPFTTTERSHITSQYDGGIAAEDAAIAALIRRLRELGLYDNTLIIVTSDHGEAIGDHDLSGHKIGFVYQELVGVPLLIKFPGQTEARRSDGLISQVDLMPTILAAVGIPAPTGIQGKSRFDAEGEEVLYSSALSDYQNAKDRRFHGARRAIFAGSLKLITWTAGPPELYNLATDPKEQHDLYSSADPQAMDLMRRLDAWVATMPKQKAESENLDPVTVERLKSLGYVQ
jgi:arylsulfatase A-like enzyme